MRIITEWYTVHIVYVTHRNTYKIEENVTSLDNDWKVTFPQSLVFPDARFSLILSFIVSLRKDKFLSK